MTMRVVRSTMGGGNSGSGRWYRIDPLSLPLSAPWVSVQRANSLISLVARLLRNLHVRVCV